MRLTIGINFSNLLNVISKVGIDKAKKEVEEEGVGIIEAFVVEKESVVLRLSDFAEQVVFILIAIVGSCKDETAQQISSNTTYSQKLKK